MIETISYYWNTFSVWISNLGLEFGVDPWIFAFFYVGLAPVVWIGAAVMVRNCRQKKSLLIPGLITVVTFFSPYIYIFIAGNNLPVWVYISCFIFASIGSYSLWNKIFGKTHQASPTEN